MFIILFVVLPEFHHGYLQLQADGIYVFDTGGTATREAR